MKEIDSKWPGTVILQQECLDNPQFMERFEQLYADHQEATWKTYEMQTMNQEIWLWRWIGPAMFLSGLEMAKKRITEKDVLGAHMVEMDKKYMEI